MAGSLEGKTAPESAGGLTEFHHEIRRLQRNRTHDATIHDIVVERLGEVEHGFWLRYKNVLFEATANAMNIHDKEKVARYIKELASIIKEFGESGKLDGVYEDWMRNRLSVLISNLKALEEGSLSSDDTQEVFGDLTKERNEIFG